MEEKQKLFTDLFSNADDGIIYMILGSLISADNNNTVEEIDENLENLRFLIEPINACTRADEEKEKLLDFVESGIRILEKDKEYFTADD